MNGCSCILCGAEAVIAFCGARCREDYVARIRGHRGTISVDDAASTPAAQQSAPLRPSEVEESAFEAYRAGRGERGLEAVDLETFVIAMRKGRVLHRLNAETLYGADLSNSKAGERADFETWCRKAGVVLG